MQRTPGTRSRGGDVRLREVPSGTRGRWLGARGPGDTAWGNQGFPPRSGHPEVSLSCAVSSLGDAALTFPSGSCPEFPVYLKLVLYS